ncbi:MAG: hypothetical protein ABL973_13620 [Micropepsaceae bacterium]
MQIFSFAFELPLLHSVFDGNLSGKLVYWFEHRGDLQMKSKEFEKFEDDDEGFKKWRKANPNGFILNLPRPPEHNKRQFYLGAVKLHSAQCPNLQPDKNGEKPWTSTGYIKICATNANELVKWFDAHADKPASWQPPRCKRSKCHK